MGIIGEQVPVASSDMVSHITEEAAPAPISHSTAPLAVASGPIGSAGWAVKRELNVEAAGQVEVVKRVKKKKKGLGSENKPIVVSDVSPPYYFHTFA